MNETSPQTISILRRMEYNPITYNHKYTIMYKKILDISNYLQTSRRELRNFLGWLILTIFIIFITILFELANTWLVPVIAIFLLGSFIELIVVALDLPKILSEIYPGIILLILCVWLIITEGSPSLLAGIAFASGWIFCDIKNGGK